MSEWAKSSILEAGCRQLVDLGYMPEKPLIGWRSAFGEAVPKPGTGETVVFAPFFERGFSLPTHPFFRRLLGYYGLQLHHLNPNGILHISIFITLCEAYLGIEPHFGLWKWLYCVRPVCKQDNSACACAIGGAGIQLRSKTRYVSIPLRTSNKGWHSRWFYCRNEKPSLPDFVGDPPVKLPSWSDPPSANQMAEVEKIIPHLNDLIRNGLDGAHLIATFMSRRIQPIKKRCHGMSEFTGNSDPARERSMKLTEDEIFSRVSQLVSTDTNICTDGKPLPYHHKRPPKNDLSKYLSATLEEDEKGVYMLLLQKGKEVVVRSCSELAQRRESGNSAPIAQPPPDDEDTETLSHWKKRKSAEALICSTLDPGLLQDLSSLTIYKRKKLSKDFMLPCLLPHSSASPAKEASSSASREAADLTVPHREMPDDESVPLSPPQAASPSPTPQSEPRPLQSPPTRHASPPTTTLSTLTVPESIEMAHVSCRPLPCDNLGFSRQLVGFTTDSVEVEGEVQGKKAEKEPGMLSVQMKDAESKLLWETDDEKECVMVEWEKVKEAAMSFVTRLPEMSLSFKRASELILKLKQENKDLKVKLKQENKDLEVKLKQEKELVVKLKQENKELEVKLKQENKELEVKLKQENEVARAFEKKASDLSKELDIVRADRDSLSRTFQDAKKKAADFRDAFNAFHAACDKFSIDNPTLDGVEVVTKQLGNFPTELTDEAAAAGGGHCHIGMQLAHEVDNLMVRVAGMADSFYGLRAYPVLGTIFRLQIKFRSMTVLKRLQ